MFHCCKPLKPIKSSSKPSAELVASEIKLLGSCIDASLITHKELELLHSFIRHGQKFVVYAPHLEGTPVMFCSKQWSEYTQYTCEEMRGVPSDMMQTMMVSNTPHDQSQLDRVRTAISLELKTPTEIGIVSDNLTCASSLPLNVFANSSLNLHY